MTEEKNPVGIAAKWGPHLVAAMQHYHLDTPERSAMFLAQEQNP